ncbi:MAG: hypothetical protein ACR2QF_05495 [Geminicoccaceae bacterium]
MTIEYSEAVDQARIEFEQRWRPCDLAHVDTAFADRFDRQLKKWQTAQITGTVGGMAAHSAAMVRAYAAAIEVMQNYRHTAYLLGYDREQSVAVCISAHSESVEHAQRSMDCDVEWITPEAVARLVAHSRAIGIAIEDKEDRLS